MKNFHFSLEPILKLRNHQQTEALMNWAKILQEVHVVAEECRALKTELEDWQAFRRRQQTTAMSAADLNRTHQLAHEFYVRWLTRERLKQSLENQAREAFRRWQTLHRKEEVLERLKDRTWVQWSRERDLQEQKEIDERAASFRNQRSALVMK